MALLGGVPRVWKSEAHLVLLDELAHHLHRLGRAVAVVVGDVVDLAAVDAALVVDLLEVGADGLADGAVGGGGAAVGVGVADLDLGGGHARRPSERRRRRRRRDARPTASSRARNRLAMPHDVLLVRV